MDSNSPVIPETSDVHYQEYSSLCAQHAPAIDVHEILLGKVQYDEEVLKKFHEAIVFDDKLNISREASMKEAAKRLKYVMSEEWREFNKGWYAYEAEENKSHEREEYVVEIYDKSMS